MSTNSVNDPGGGPIRRLHQVFEDACDRVPGNIALECESVALTYAELDRHANRLAHHLLRRGIGPGSRVAIMLPRSVHTYVALLGIGKAGAAFVPIDPGSPADRVSYIVTDADVDLVLTCTALAEVTAGLDVARVQVDTTAVNWQELPTTRPILATHGADPTAYVMYTSGSSGRPKGVEIAQSSIRNFLDVVPEVYDVRPDDRVYQGMTISFDFCIEEIWPTWTRGATLVAGPNDSRRLGAELADFLDQRDITVLYCVPTLLATLPRDLPKVRALMVGGEACPAPLVERWSTPGRRMLNTYGPTEATVTATWGELLPGRPVTIGRPMPTYSVVLLDEHREPVPDGEIGEICIGGAGVARGYVGRPDLTADRFIQHRLAPPGSRLYRTGDLGRITPDGEIEYKGRADAEVKIRGHRVDLGEIDNVLLEEPGVAEAVAALMPLAGRGTDQAELTAYVVRTPTGDGDSDEQLGQRLHARLRETLPAYMVPGLFDVVTALPTMPSGKVDRTKLPAPTGRRFAAAGPVVGPANDLERRVRAVWAEAFGIDEDALSVRADFFDDLGGHSLLAARIVSLLRERGIGASPTVRDVYSHPTIQGMAAQLASAPTRTRGTVPSRVGALRHSSRRIVGAGVAQALAFYGLLFAITFPVAYVYTNNDGAVSVDVLVQLLAAVLVSYLAVRWLVPLLLVRPLSVGIKPGRYRLWGVTYVRLWAVNLLMMIGPLPVLSGSPLMSGYLRMMGARVGDRTTINTSAISLPELLDIGDNASIGYGVSLRPWRVEDGWVVVDRVRVGSDSFVGANAVLEPGSTVSANAGVGELSVLGAGDTVPDGARWSGSPAQPVARLSQSVEDMLTAPDLADRWLLRHLLAAGVGLAALEVAAIAMIVPSVALVWWALLTWGVLAGLAATLVAGPVFVLTVCAVVAGGKALVLRTTPVGVHPVCSALGLRKWVVDKLLEFSLTFTNSLYATLYAVPWLRLLGARVGSGSEVSTAAHLDPDLLTLGEESFVADMASVGAATYANGHVAFLRTEVGDRAFVGNAALVPAGTGLGDNSLLGVMTVPPAEGVPEGTSWLGSPAMHLPLRQDSGSFSESDTFSPPRRVYAQRLMIEFFRVTLPASVLGVSAYLFLLVLSMVAQGRTLLIPALTSPLIALGSAVLVVLFCAAVKRNVAGVYAPRVEPLWSTFVRRSEFATGMYEAAAVPAGVGLLIGTPFLPPVLRSFGARIGRRCWIGTTYLTEFDLVDIGDDVVIGTEVSLQTHLFEDRVMKMSVVTVRSGASVGTRAIVLYDGVVGDAVALGSLSLVMKGETLPSGTRWHGIPAQGLGDAVGAAETTAVLEPVAAAPAESTVQLARPAARGTDLRRAVSSS